MLNLRDCWSKRSLRRGPLPLPIPVVGFAKCMIFMTMLLSAIDKSASIDCYRCDVTTNPYRTENTTVPLCRHFDKSDDYVASCPFSTMCLKTISAMHLLNGEKQYTITRGCANQKDTVQVFRNQQWHVEHPVKEVYKEGCAEFKENSLASAVKTYCYCRGELCNAAIGLTDTISISMFMTQTLAVVLYKAFLSFQ